jgi:hypothetical protein
VPAEHSEFQYTAKLVSDCYQGLDQEYDFSISVRLPEGYNADEARASLAGHAGSGEGSSGRAEGERAAVVVKPETWSSRVSKADVNLDDEDVQ